MPPASFTQAARPRGYIWQFDILRGLAVLAVIYFHAGKHLPRHQWLVTSGWYGWCGVDLFFVLSGFLITGILLDARGTDGFFTNFYARRILRIWPLYFAMLGMLLVVLPHIVPAMMAESVASARPVWAYPLFLQNLFNYGKPVGPLGVTWSLAVEEQFYFVWPLLIYFLKERTLRRVLVGVLLFEPVLRLGMSLSGATFTLLYTSTFTRLDGLAAGCLLAVLLRRWGAEVVRASAKYAVVPAVAITLAAGMLHEAWLLFSALALLFTAIAALAMTWQGMPRIGFLAYTGRISFGLYLLHLPVMDLLAAPRIRPHLGGDWGYAAASFVGMYALASASFYGFEQPILKFKKYFVTRRAITAEMPGKTDIPVAA
jgi:peptidoglycan/LPS O-acetylase OafA/YrhL